MLWLLARRGAVFRNTSTLADAGQDGRGGTGRRVTSSDSDFFPPGDFKLDESQWGPLERSPGCAGDSARLDDKCGWPLSPAQCKRLEGGLDKLKEATIQLDELNQKLAEQKIVLAEKSAACEALLEEIAINTATGESGPGMPHATGLGSRGDVSEEPRVGAERGIF